MVTLMTTDIAPITAERLEQLAYEFALEYHSPADLAARFALPHDLLTRIQSEPRFHAKVLEQRRAIDEGGDQTRLVARKLVSQLVPSMAALADNDKVDAKDRIAAFKALKEVAGITDQSAASSGGQFAIQINLGVSSP